MKNRNIGILLGLLPFLAIILTLFVRWSVDNTLLTDNAAAQPYPHLQPFPSTSQIQQSQQPLQQPSQNPSIGVFNGNSNNNPFQNLQNQINQLKAIISNLHTQKLVVTERSAPDFVQYPTQSKAVCNSDEVVTGGGLITTGSPPLGNAGELGVVESNASGNGWIVQLVGMPYKAVAECAKLTDG
jgi:hypothetical protein